MAILQPTSGYRDPLKAMSIKALQKRQEAAALAAAKAQEMPQQIANPWQGVAHLTGILGSEMREGQVGRALQEQQAGMNALMGQIDPATGATQAQIAAMGAFDPEVATQLWTDRASKLRADAERANWQPMTDADRARYGIPPGVPAQINITTGEVKHDFPPTGQTINVGGEGTPLDKELGIQEGKSWAGMQVAGGIASQQLGDFATLDALSKVAPSGGLTGELAKRFPQFNDAAAAMTSVIERLAPTFHAPGSGATSDIEYAGFLKALPSLRNKPAANAAIISLLKQKADITVAMGNVVNQYRNGEITQVQARQTLQVLMGKHLDIPPEMQAVIDAAQKGEGTTGQTTPPAAGALPHVSTQADVDALPNGTDFIWTDGNTYTKHSQPPAQ